MSHPVEITTADLQRKYAVSIHLMRKDKHIPRQVVYQLEIAVLKCLHRHSVNNSTANHVHQRYLQRRATAC